MLELVKHQIWAKLIGLCLSNKKNGCVACMMQQWIKLVKLFLKNLFSLEDEINYHSLFLGIFFLINELLLCFYFFSDK